MYTNDEIRQVARLMYKAALCELTILQCDRQIHHARKGSSVKYWKAVRREANMNLMQNAGEIQGLVPMGVYKHYSQFDFIDLNKE